MPLANRTGKSIWAVVSAAFMAVVSHRCHSRCVCLRSIGGSAKAFLLNSAFRRRRALSMNFSVIVMPRLLPIEGASGTRLDQAGGEAASHLIEPPKTRRVFNVVGVFFFSF